MRVEFLFFRWLLIIAAVAFGLVYVGSSHSTRPGASYETIPLIQGGRSSGMPLAGIVVDSTRRDVYAIVGGPAKDDAVRPFCIVWKGKEGETFGTTFPAKGTGAEALFEVSPDGRIRAVHNLSTNDTGRPTSPSEATANAETTLRSVLGALPPSAGLR